MPRAGSAARPPGPAPRGRLRPPDSAVPAKLRVAARHPRRHPTARGARPRVPHAPRSRAVLRRLEGPRRRPDDGLRAGRTGHILTLPRAELVRQLRRHRRRAAFRGEEAQRERVVSEIRKARLTGIRVAVPVEEFEARLSVQPEDVSVEPGRIEVRFQRGEGRRRAALRARPAADERLRVVRGARRGERRRERRGRGEE